jgi:hypothetical protein
MGCDIHGVIERHAAGKLWITCGLVPDRRHYAFFAALCGVRAYHPEDTGAYPGRGVPAGFEINDDGMTGCEWNMRYWLGDHSYSWCALAEMKRDRDECAKKAQRLDPVHGGGVLSSWDAWIEVADAYRRAFDGPDSDDDIRFVFGFDN